MSAIGPQKKNSDSSIDSKVKSNNGADEDLPTETVSSMSVTEEEQKETESVEATGQMAYNELVEQR